jgi:hypothetical protein
MIYILTGIAKSGKSLVVKEIQSKINIPIISTDQIMMDIHKQNVVDDLDIYASDRTVAHKLEPFITASITANIKEKKTVLYEGVHFKCPFARSLLNQYKSDIRILYLGYKDIDVKAKTEELYRYKHLIDNDWIFDHKGEAVEDIVAYMITESERVYQECLAYQLPYLEVRDINQQMNTIIQMLLDK